MSRCADFSFAEISAASELPEMMWNDLISASMLEEDSTEMQGFVQMR